MLQICLPTTHRQLSLKIFHPDCFWNPPILHSFYDTILSACFAGSRLSGSLSPSYFRSLQPIGAGVRIIKKWLNVLEAMLVFISVNPFPMHDLPIMTLDCKFLAFAGNGCLRTSVSEGVPVALPMSPPTL